MSRGTRTRLGNRCRLVAVLFALLPLAAAASTPSVPPLIEAAKNGDAAAVRALLRQTSAGAAQVDGTTALHWAAQRDDVAIADLLMKAGANVTATNRYRMTPLALAAINGSARMIERLIGAGADANGRIAGGETMLMAAARSGRPEAVKILLAKGADVNARDIVHAQTALMWAAARGNVDVVSVLLEAGAAINATTPLVTRIHPNDESPFTAALDAGGQSGYLWADVDPSAFSALHYAVRAGHIATSKVLLDGGANVNDALSNGMAPLLLAVENMHYELAAYLLERGADPNANGAGWTALHRAIRGRRAATRFHIPTEPTGRMSSLDFIKKLLASGASPNVRMWNDGMKDGQRTRFHRMGATPLLIAAKTGDLEVMRLLVAHGAHPFTSTVDNLSPMMAAAGVALYNPGEDAGSITPEQIAERFEAVKWLVSLGADVNQADVESETALHGAVYLGSPELAAFLIEKGARLDAKNDRGWTPLMAANGAAYADFFKEQPEVAVVLRKSMTARGMSTENQIADATVCKQCFTSRGLEAAIFEEHGYALQKNTALVDELKSAK